MRSMKILAALAMPIVTAAVFGGVLERTHHTSLPSLAPPPPSAKPLTTHLIKASGCERKFQVSSPFTGVAVRQVSSGAVQAFTTATKSPVGVVEFYNPFPAKFDEADALGVVSLHDVPLIQLQPGKHDAQVLRRIANGRDDTEIKHYAEAVKKFGYCIIISFAHEMNGWWYHWGMPFNTPATFIKAWRHVHDIFANAGVGNVIWSWDPSHLNVAIAPKRVASPASEWYPGRDYVDWVGLDGYLGQAANGTPQTFSEIFGPQVANIRSIAPHKVLYLAETGVGHEAGQLTQINALFNGISKYHMAGLVWFELNRKNQWKLEGRPAMIQAYHTRVNQFPVPAQIDVPSH